MEFLDHKKTSKNAQITWRCKIIPLTCSWNHILSIILRHFLTLGKTICCTVGKFYLSLTLMSFSNNPCWSLFIFSRINNKWFLLAICLPQNTIFVVESKGFWSFLPTCKRSYIIIIGVLSTIFAQLRNLELLSHRSPWKCYPTSTFATYYPIRSMTLQRAYIWT